MDAAGFNIETLVLDAAPLLSTANSSNPASLRGLAQNFVTTPDVLGEIRDKTSRELFASTLQLLGIDGAASGVASGEALSSENGGLQVKQPSEEAVARVSNFAKLTGDIAVLSEADIRVLALTYALEVEKNGMRRLRAIPGQLSPEEKEREQKKQDRLQKQQVEAQTKKLAAASLQKTQDEVAHVTADHAEEASTSSTAAAQPSGKDGEQLVSVDTQDGWQQVGEGAPAQSEDSQESPDAVGEEADAASKAEGSESSDGEWITPNNVTLHRSRDLGLFPSLPSSSPSHFADGFPATGKQPKQKQKTLLKVACLTGDFAMQNVALQMGLNVFGVGGKKVREVRTWVLRCHACFKLCKDPTRKFCPSCGNGSSLIRTSITYVTPTPANPQGYILHLKQNFQYRLRGTQFSIPPPKPGSSNALKNSNNADLILREDQKEWLRGVKSHEFTKAKQDKAAAKAMRDGKGSTAVFGGNADWNDPDWLPGLITGTKQSNQAGIRTGKDGLPIVGYGKRNPNEGRRRR